jgi:hypothetical protein
MKKNGIIEGYHNPVRRSHQNNRSRRRISFLPRCTRHCRTRIDLRDILQNRTDNLATSFSNDLNSGHTFAINNQDKKPDTEEHVSHLQLA